MPLDVTESIHVRCALSDSIFVCVFGQSFTFFFKLALQCVDFFALQFHCSIDLLHHRSMICRMFFGFLFNDRSQPHAFNLQCTVFYGELVVAACYFVNFQIVRPLFLCIHRSYNFFMKCNLKKIMVIAFIQLLLYIYYFIIYVYTNHIIMNDLKYSSFFSASM